MYLGGYDKDNKAARAYDLASLKYLGTTTTTNFHITNYEELEEMKHMTEICHISFKVITSEKAMNAALLLSSATHNVNKKLVPLM
ncbi:AP2-like ethylene-responsive transcription factor AIL5 [Dioscorea cayenensis subsp. rotundata]|uniref:AP2-like ethylene-responsive transcription factor AIL5 n=1 Tax=Dioscorea cayennensis subsp. rotundata TaxID=55577 RepID=A0AB40CTN8_DIOCR|nr:AP2-like ethylene-responsive transcription factor AIL5 [Dioscorea cayenensis subsp. rotundata]